MNSTESMDPMASGSMQFMESADFKEPLNSIDSVDSMESIYGFHGDLEISGIYCIPWKARPGIRGIMDP